MLDYSFHSQQNTKAILKLQQSILNQYQRLKFGQQSIQYSINTLNYTIVPSYFPEHLQNNGKCLKLSNCKFFEMLSYSIYEYLLTNRSAEKDEVLKKIKKIICDKKFMIESPTTKGLLLKGIKMMYDNSEIINNQIPVAHCLWRNDCMMAFTQFWKALLSRASIKNVIMAETVQVLDKNLFQIIADQFQINIIIYFQKDMQFQRDIYSSNTKQSTLNLKIIIYSNDQQKVDSSKILSNSFGTQKQSKNNYNDDSLEWNYIVITDNCASDLSREQISAIHVVNESEIEEKSEIERLLRCKTKSNLTQGSFVKEEKGLQTTRTKKSAMSTARIRNQRDENLEEMRRTILKGDSLIDDLKIFCSSLKC